MEMKELFYKDPYAKEFDSVVVSCEKCGDGFDVVLEDTLFYPEGGGQPCDLGIINGISVNDVQRDKEDVIHHYLSDKIETGACVHGIIDWERRFDLMQNHTGEHIVSGLIHQMYGYENVGFHMGDVLQIDLSGSLTWQQVLEVEEKANEIIYQNSKVVITYPTQEELKTIAYRSKKELEGTVRIVTIENADVCACCGTHVKYTGEIGLIKILSCFKHKNGVRMELVCGKRAFLYLQKAFEQVRKISGTLSAKPLEIAQFVDKVLEKNTDLTARLKEKNRETLWNRALSFTEKKHLLIDFVEGIDRNTLLYYANCLKEKQCADIICVMNQEENGTYSYLILSQQIDLRAYGKEVNQKLFGRGGGKAEMLQGSFSCEQDDIKTGLKEIFCYNSEEKKGGSHV